MYISAIPGGHKSTPNDVVNLNVGDPVRKNTLCVEISPPTHEVSILSKYLSALHMTLYIHVLI